MEKFEEGQPEVKEEVNKSCISRANKQYNRANKKYLQWVKRQKRFNDWLDDTTIHGTVRVFKAKSFIRRFLWSIIFLGAFAGCLYNVVDRINFFFSFPSATTISLITRSNGIPFPAVTICNVNFLSRSTAEMFNLTNLIDSLGSLNVGRCYASAEFSPAQNIPLREIIQNGSQPMDEFIKACFFTGTKIEDCRQFMTPRITDLGYCYTFNGQIGAPERLIRNTGSRYGLDLVLNVSQGDYLPILNSAGVRIAIHPRDVPPEADEQGIAVPPQRSAFIGLRTSNVVDGSAQKNCRERNDVQLPFFPPEYGYSLPACRQNALYELVARNCCCLAAINDTNIETEQFVEQCNITGPSLPNCTVMDSCCILQQNLELSLNDTCPSACNYTTYEASTSYAAYPSMNGAAASFIESLDDVNDNILSATIFFEEPYIETVKTQDSYSPTALLSDIGGQLGLFLGASVISMIEFGWFLVDEMFDFFKKCYKSKKKALSHKPPPSNTVSAMNNNSDHISFTE